MKTLGFVILCTALALACGNENKNKPAADNPAPTATAEPALAETKPETPKPPKSDVEVPTEEDFEDEASKEITPNKLDKELKSLEEEIGE